MSSREVRDRWIVVAILWFSHTVYFFNYMTIGTLAPFIQPELRLSSAQIGLFCSAVTIGSMASQIPIGILSDVFGAKWAMVFGLLLIGGSNIAISSLHSYLSIFLLLILLGMGIGCNQAPASKAIISWFPSRGRATAMGFKQTGINLGAILASFILPVLALQYNSWRPPFRVAGLVAFLPAAFVLFFYKEKPADSDGPSQPVIVKKETFYRLLFDRNFQMMCLLGIFLMIIQHSFSTYFLLYGTKVLNLPVEVSGRMLAIAFAMGAIARVGWSYLSDYVLGGRRRIVFILIGAIGAFVSVAFIFLKAFPATWLIYFFVILFGLTGVGWTAIYLTMIGEFPGKELTGIATGIAFILTNIGVLVGPPLFGFFVDLTGGYTLSWSFIGVCMAMVALLAKIQRKERLRTG
jgi:MFS transporter, ACS family, hexuronate transporter